MSPTAQSRLELIGLTKAYPGCIANDAVDLRVNAGEIHALLGENGAGKSTLMKMIYGVVKPDNGEILWNNKEVRVEGPGHARSLGMGMVFQHFSLFDTLTVTENIALYLTPKEYGSLSQLRQRISQVADEYHMAINPDRLVQSLSVGEQQRVEIIRCLLQDIQLLILDEPTAVLTPPEVTQLTRMLKQLAQKGCSILFISHKLHEVKALCDRATVLRAGKVTGSCDPATTSLADMARLMLGDDLTLEHELPSGRPGEVRLQLRDVMLNAGGQFGMALQNINLELRSGEILGLAGVAGNGQDELVSLIHGELAADGGLLTLDGQSIAGQSQVQRRRKGLATVPADRMGRGSVASLSLTENQLLTGYVTHGVHHYLVKWRSVRKRAAHIIHQYGVKAGGPDELAGSLSGGNLQKFIVGRELEQNPRVLICFHPTWGVDLGAANKIHQALVALRDRGTAILVISEDLDELFLLSDRLGAICGGQLSPLEPKPQVGLDQLGEWMAGSFIKQNGGATHAH